MKFYPSSTFCAIGLSLVACAVKADVVFQDPPVLAVPGEVVADGTAVTLNAAVTTDSGLAIYQWLKNDVPLSNGSGISGVTTNKLVIKPARQSNTGDYRIQVREIILGGGLGDPVLSDPLSLTVHQRPVIVSHPVSQTKNQDDELMLSVEISPASEQTLQYEWQLNNVPIDAMANPSAATKDFIIPARDPMDPGNFPGVQLPDAGSYRVKVTNLSGVSVFSKSASVRVNSAAVILVQPPADFYIATKSRGKLPVVAGGTPKIQFQWEIEGLGNVTKGGNAASITIPGTPESDGKRYRVTVSNGLTSTEHPADVSIWSEIHVINKLASPVVTGMNGATTFEKGSGLFDAGSDPTLTVQASLDNTGDLEYQWQKDGKNISDMAGLTGTNARTLVFTDIQWTARGTYRCIVKNQVGVVTSKTFKVEVNSPPVILTQPQMNVVGITGGKATMTVIAGGSGKLAYQWFKKTLGGPVPIAKATKNRLSLSKLAKTDPAGEDYYCEVRNALTDTLGGGVPTSSEDSNLVVYDPARITSHPASQSVRVTNNATLTVGVTGDEPLVYEWWFGKQKLVNGMLGSATIAGADTNALQINNIQSGLQGSYYCMVRNAKIPGMERYLTNVKSKTAKLNVIMPPTIARDTQSSPASPVVEEDRVVISIVGGGTPPLRYQWEKANASDGPWTPIQGKTSPQLIFTKVTLADDAWYRCVVNNSLNEPVESTPLELEVDLIPSPVITSFTPQLGRGGEFIRVTGQYFDYTKSVSIVQDGAATGLNAVFAIESPTSLLITIPNASPLADSRLRITNRGSNAPTVSPGIFRRTTVYANDANNVRILVGAVHVQIDGDNSGLVDPLYSYVGNNEIAWYSWRPTAPGTYNIVVAALASMDVDLIYRRPAPTPQNPDAYATLFGAAVGDEAFVTPSVTENVLGRDHFIGITSYLPLSSIAGGPFLMSILPLTAQPILSPGNDGELQVDMVSPSMIQADSASWTSDKGEAFSLVRNSIGEEVVRLGGGAGGVEPTVLWSESVHRIPADSSKVKCTFHAGLDEVGDGFADFFAWQVTAQDGAPLLQLRLNSADGSIELVQPDGFSQKADPILVSESQQYFEISLDFVSGAWTASMNGVSLGSALPLPQGAVFGDLSAVWYPADASGAVSSMSFDQVSVRSE